MLPRDHYAVLWRPARLSHDVKLPGDRWSHVAATVNAEGAIVLYVDGKLAAQRKWQPLPAEDFRQFAPKRLRCAIFMCVW